MNPRPATFRIPRRRQGLSLVEVVMSTLLVGLVLVGAMNLLGAVVRGRTKAADLARGQRLTQQLMTEILNSAYKEDGSELGADYILNALLVVIGQETRSQYDDVDDFHGWDETPLFARGGSLIPNTSGWRRRVAVAWVDPVDPGIVVGSDQGVKRITVTVQRNGQTIAQLACLRSDGYPPVTPP